MDIYLVQVQELLALFCKHYQSPSPFRVMGVLSRCLELQKMAYMKASSQEERALFRKVIEQKEKELTLLQKLSAIGLDGKDDRAALLDDIRSVDRLISMLAMNAVGDNARFYRKLEFESCRETFAEKLKNTREWKSLVDLMRDDSLFGERSSIRIICDRVDVFFEKYTGCAFGLHQALGGCLARLHGPENIIVSDVLKCAYPEDHGSSFGSFEFYFQKILKLLSPLVLAAH